MRLSVNQSDPGYSPIAHLARVWLAGAERTDWITADTDKRFALLSRLDTEGRAITKDGKPLTEDFWGDVRIEPAQIVGASWPYGYDTEGGRMAWSKESRHARGYGTAWTKLRLVILQRDQGLCQCPDCQGGKRRLRSASEVDHIVPKADAQRRGWTPEQTDHPSNLRAVNADCHKKLTLLQTGKRLKPTIGADGWPTPAVVSATAPAHGATQHGRGRGL